jgi:hypothetical protein
MDQQLLLIIERPSFELAEKAWPSKRLPATGATLAVTFSNYLRRWIRPNSARGLEPGEVLDRLDEPSLAKLIADLPPDER